MSNKELKIFNDEFSEEESKSLAMYIENGCPGLTRITDDKVLGWLELYMAGKTFLEISKTTNDKLDLILYIAHKSKWQAIKIEYFQDIQKNLAKKVATSRLESANTVMSIMSALGKYQKKKADKYIATNDDAVMENFDVKLFAAYCKSIDILGEMMSLGSEKNNGPKVNINVGTNASVSQNSDGSLEVNSDAGVSDLLKSLADFKKSQEKK
jgi:hypothetical protein